MEDLEISLGKFRDDVVNMTAPRLTRDDPLDPLAISLAVGNIAVVLGASPHTNFQLKQDKIQERAVML